MKRFAGLRSALPWILGLVLFAGMIVWLVMGLSNASSASEEERLAQVRQSVENGVTLCYAVEGAYREPGIPHGKLRRGIRRGQIPGALRVLRGECPPDCHGYPEGELI